MAKAPLTAAASAAAVIASASATELASGFSHSTCLPACERRDGDLGMGVTGRADVDQIYIVAVDQSAPVCLDGVPAHPIGRSLRSGGVPAGKSGEFRSPREVEESGRRPPGLRVGGTHERVADHADPQWTC